MNDDKLTITTAPVVMDLAVLGDGAPHRALEELVWPTKYADYHALSRTLIDSLAQAIRAQSPGADGAAVLRAKAYDIITDLAFITRLAFDLANVRRSGRIMNFDATASPMLAFLDAGGDPSKSPVLRIWHHPVDRRLRTRLRKALHRARSHQRAHLAGKNRIDVHNRNNLVNNLLDTEDYPAVDWPATNLDWRHARDIPPFLADSVAEIARAFSGVVGEYIEEDGLRETLSALGADLVRRHVAKSWVDFETMERHMRARPTGDMLVSGTPKHLGRLAGWLYRREGKPVVRCAHGGERVFFADYEWGLAEFPDCDTYYAHSSGERDALAARLATGGTALIEPGHTVAFRTLGSPHHQDLRAKAHKRNKRQTTGTIVYVAGGYLGEQFGDYPNRKPPDILYLDWQIDLVRALQDLGYRVGVKPHPAGIAQAANYLAHYADTLLQGRFDPLAMEPDAFVFDFAGTAFFDTLATDAPMLFADLGIRPFDETIRADLAARCPIVPATLDARGRFRIDRNRLGESLGIAIAADPCPPDFHNRYFGA
jgi:hypothetical protein